jgi:hypothetical protein
LARYSHQAKQGALAGRILMSWLSTLLKHLPQPRPVRVFVDDGLLNDAPLWTPPIATPTALDVGFIMALQNPTALTEQARTTLFTHTGSKISFRLNSLSIGDMAPQLGISGSGGDLRPEDLTELPTGCAYANVLTAPAPGAAPRLSGPFRFTVPRSQAENPGRAALARIEKVLRSSENVLAGAELDPGRIENVKIALANEFNEQAQLAVSGL